MNPIRPSRRHPGTSPARPTGRAGRVAALLVWVLAAGRPLHGASIVDSKHNLSATGPGPYRAVTESQICIFCHTPHAATSEAPLWNRYSSGAVYTTYSSSTTRASIGQPTGASKLCLSCHDGTVALGMVRSRTSPIVMAGGADRLDSAGGGLSTDLSDDHPVSFVYDAALQAAHGELRSPALLTGPVRLENGEVQCTSCHDPHDNQYGDFLVMDNEGSALCTECHLPAGWSGAIHQSSTASWNGSLPDPWPHTDRTTVAANGCENCHQPHHAPAHERLLTRATEEEVCLVCHNGQVAASDLQAEFAKSSVHPVQLTTGVHDPAEDLVNPPRHVECVDCHNPHAAREQTAVAPDATGALAGVAGIDLAGSVTDPLQFEYELCFRCHGDSTQRGQALIPRQFVQTNTRQEFDPANASYHPVAAQGVNPDVPSLIAPQWQTTSRIYCTDCHNNDTGPGAGGPGPNGPHGSQYRPILERRLELTDGQSENSSLYALCYKCHSRASILANESFKEHRKHIQGEKAACTTCHDPHGVQSSPHLINFNTQYVTPSKKNGRLEFVDRGRFRGECSLTCHGKDHDRKSY
ncbi:MAG: hypothetical protein D6766_02325 [Verrucomicrobia bacterium]|nr:MAG: hypothetical protein D6766_02325 [Verrucomicrobiota bacterium]